MKYDNEFQRRPKFVLIWMFAVAGLIFGLTFIFKTLFQ
jgi:hypothetical protein